VRGLEIFYGYLWHKRTILISSGREFRRGLNLVGFYGKMTLLKLTDFFEIGQFERRAYISVQRVDNLVG